MNAATPHRLGPWRLCAAVGLTGLGLLAATGHIVLGASVTALAFALAAVLRAVLPD